jgi:hypothetical protein
MLHIVIGGRKHIFFRFLVYFFCSSYKYYKFEGTLWKGKEKENICFEKELIEGVVGCGKWLCFFSSIIDMYIILSWP